MKIKYILNKAEIRNSIKLIKLKFIESIYWLALISMKKNSVKSHEKIIIIPPTDLDGSFGDDLLISAVVENYSKSFDEISILQERRIERHDLFKKNKVNYKTINYYRPFALLNLIKEYSLIYLISADNMDGNYSIYKTSFKFYIFKFAKKLDIPCKMSGGSFKKNLAPVIKRQIKKYSTIIEFKARDIYSLERLTKLNLKKEPILTSDLAFLIEIKSTNSSYYDWIKKQKINKKLIIGICPNAIQSNKIGLEKYISFYLKVLEGDWNFAIVPIYHDLRLQKDSNSDYTISKRISIKTKSLGYSTYFPNEIRNGIEMKSIINELDFLISGRMHATISAFNSGIPSICLSYVDKFEGLFKYFNLTPEEFILNYKEGENLVDKLNYLLKNYDYIIKQISSNLLKVKKLARENFK